MLMRIVSAANTVGAFAAKLLGGWSMTQELLFCGSPVGRRFLRGVRVRVGSRWACSGGCVSRARREGVSAACLRWCMPRGRLQALRCIFSKPVCASGQAATQIPAWCGYLAGVTQEAAGAGKYARKFRGDVVSTRKRLMAKNATASIMQRKRENFMARLRCPKQAAASGKEPLQAVACYFRQTDRTGLTTTG